MTPSRDITRLLEIMKALRTPVTGCPWDLAQDFSSIAPYTIEEAYEVADAIHRKDMGDLCEELGDLLLQVVYHSQMAAEENSFEFGDVVEAVTRKMIRRHPHVFGDVDAEKPEHVDSLWDKIKAEEKAERKERRAALGIAETEPRYLDSVPRVFPALAEAEKLQKRASKVGFDWGAAGPVLDKIREEVEELSSEVHSSVPDRDKIEDELGDVLFAVANLARHLDIAPEQALKRTNNKFRTRFAHIEEGAQGEGRTLEDLSLHEMEAYWQEAKTLAPSFSYDDEDDDDFDDAEFVEGDDIWIRPYTAEDFADVVSCWELATRLAHPFFSEDFIASEKHNLEHVYLPNTVTYVAEAEGKVVGFIALMGNEIGGLFVSPDHHRQGIARTLVDVAIALNPLGLKVEVFEKNDGGKSFYSAYGFEKSEAKTFEPLNEPLLVMTYAPR